MKLDDVLRKRSAEALCCLCCHMLHYDIIWCIVLRCDVLGGQTRRHTATPANNPTDLKISRNWVTNLWLCKFRKGAMGDKNHLIPISPVLCVVGNILQIWLSDDQWWSKRGCDQYGPTSSTSRFVNLAQRDCVRGVEHHVPLKVPQQAHQAVHGGCHHARQPLRRHWERWSGPQRWPQE